jgi:hypothetical protein
MKINPDTSIVSEVFYEGIYMEDEISFSKFQLIKYLQNTHPINQLSYNFRKGIKNRQRTILYLG